MKVLIQSFWATSVNQEGFDSQSHPNSGHVIPGCVSLKGTRSSLSLAGVWTQVFRLSFHFFPVLPGSFHYAHKDAEKSHYLVVVWRPVNWNAPSSTIHGFVLPLELSVVPWTLYTQVLIVTTIQQGRDCLLHGRVGETETQRGDVLRVTQWQPWVRSQTPSSARPSLRHGPPWMTSTAPLKEFSHHHRHNHNSWSFLWLLFALWGQLVRVLFHLMRKVWNIFIKGMGNENWLLPSQDTL